MEKYPFEKLKLLYGEGSPDSVAAIELLESVKLLEFDQTKVSSETNVVFNVFQYRVLVRYFDEHVKKTVKDDDHKVLWLASHTDALKQLREIGDKLSEKQVASLGDKDVGHFVEKLRAVTKNI